SSASNRISRSRQLMHSSSVSRIFGASDDGWSCVMRSSSLLLHRRSLSASACPCLPCVLYLKPLIAMGLKRSRRPAKDNDSMLLLLSLPHVCSWLPLSQQVKLVIVRLRG